MKSADYFCSNHAHTMTEGLADKQHRSHNLRLARSSKLSTPVRLLKQNSVKTIIWIRQRFPSGVFAVRCYASAAYVVMRCLSVCLSVCVSVTFVHSVKTNKRIFKMFSLSGSHTILVFLYQTAWQYSDGNPPNGGLEYRCGRQKSRF